MPDTGKGDCPKCGGNVYQDRVDAVTGVAHCDDCEYDLSAEEYNKIIAKEEA